MSWERILGLWRVAITAVMALLLANGSEPGSIGAVALYGTLALLLVTLPDWCWIAVPVRLCAYLAELVVFIAAFQMGLPLPIHLLMIQLVMSGALLLGAAGAASGATAVLIWQVSGGAPSAQHSSAAVTLSMLLAGGILVTSVVMLRRREGTESIVGFFSQGTDQLVPNRVMQRFLVGTGASEVLITWQDPEEAVMHQWRWPRNGTREVNLVNLTEWAQSSTASAAIVGGVVAQERGLRRLSGSSPFSDIGTRLMVVPFDGGSVRGQLIVFAEHPSRQRLEQCREVAAEVSRALTFDSENRRRSLIEVERERSRIARNLHDGPLQSLIGAKLQLYTGEGAGASQTIAESVDTIGREISSLIRELRPRAAAANESRFTTRLNLLAAEVKRQWNVELELGEIPIIRSLDASGQRDLRRLIREAVVNAARHSGSQRVEVHGELAGNQLNLVVRDHGRGFPFSGRLTLGELRASGWGPRSLCERLELIGGDLAVDSTPGGSTVVMSIPLRELCS